MIRLARALRDRVWLITGAAVVFVMLMVQAAGAKYRGTDVLGNLSPESMVGEGSLTDRYPLAAYSLDVHVDVGVTELSGVPPTIAHWAAAQLWSLTSFLVRTVIDVFTWAFSLDLLGSDGDGAIGPVAAAVSSLHEHVIGEAWLAAALVIAGMWGIHKALVQRRYSQTAAGLAVSVICVLIALFFVYQPERTIGQASQWANQLSLAFLSGASRGTVDEPEKAKRHVADRLFSAQVMAPWLALNFGGRTHCVNGKDLDKDGFPAPVSPHDTAATTCRDHLQSKNGRGGYAHRFLAQSAGSDERDAEYEAIKNGHAPDDDPQFDGYTVDKSDAPAVDIQQAGGAYQRLTLAVVIFIGSLGMVCLLGFLALAVVLAQVVALVLLAFAPVALVVGVFPGAGHDVFRGWLTRLGTAVFIKAIYSLVIAVVVTVAAALGQATDQYGFLMAFGLQGVFFWAIFLYRKQITQRLTAATIGRPDAGPVRTAAQRGVDLASRPFSALTALPGRSSNDREEAKRQESALAGGDTMPPAGPADPELPGTGSPEPAPQPHGPNGSPAQLSPVVSRELAAVGAIANDNGRSRQVASEPDTTPEPAPDVTAREERVDRSPDPRPAEDVMRRARELRDEQANRPREEP
jgi:hypothetical protein